MAASQHWTPYLGDLAVMTPIFTPELSYNFWQASGFDFLQLLGTQLFGFVLLHENQCLGVFLASFIVFCKLGENESTNKTKANT